MRSRFQYLFLLIPLALLLLNSCSNQRDNKKILVFSKAIGYYHESIPAGLDAIMKLCENEGILVDTTTNAIYFHEDSLAKYSAVVFFNTSGDVLNYRQQADFERYIQTGGGFVGIHCAAATEYDWPWYGQLLGGYFLDHPEPQKAVVNKTAIVHSSTQHLEDSWERFDEWYNFRNIQSNNNVLLELDEKSYTGGKHGSEHPIAWYREFDGGRSFYTALGHTAESYSEDLYLKHIFQGILYAIGDNLLPDIAKAKSPRVPADENFVKVVLDEKLNEPMELSVFPDGRILFVERRGGIHLYLPEERRTKDLGVLSVYDGYEDGLLGVTRDPKFMETGWVYLYYSPKVDEGIQRLSRFTMEGDSLLFESEKIMLEINSQREECCHSAGSLAFGPDGLLYLSLGDNSNPLTFTHYDRSQLFAPHDERPGRKNWDSQRTAGNTNDLRGGIIRIKPEADGTYSIPEGNLFSPGDSLTRPEIYVMGGRNPFRISVDQHKNYLYYGEVGPDTGSDTERGPRGYDEFNQVREAGFYGWPYFTGNNKPYSRYDWATEVLGEKFDPNKPENFSVNNTGRNVLPPAVPAMIWYPYEVSEEFPILGDGARNAMAGPVYYSEDYPETRRKFPDYYDGKLFIYEWMRNWIMVVSFDENDSLKQIEPFLPGLELQSPMDMEFGPDGALYMLEYGTNWFTGNDDARLIRIDYNDKNRLPVAIAEAANSIGAVPLTVELSASGSYDFDKEDELTYSWSVTSPMNEVLGETKDIQHTFENPGTYKVQLKVTDSKGESSTTAVEIVAGNERPKVVIEVDGNTTFYQKGKAINYQVKVTDKEDGTLDAGISRDSVIFTINYVAPDNNEGGHKINSIPFKKGLDLIEASDCKSCHQRNQSSAGPAYTAIAERYSGQKEAIQTLAEKVINGGGGNWGEHSMAAHPQINLDDARLMVQYVLSQGSDLEGQKPLAGNYAFNEQLSAPGGVYVLKATYKDRGNAAIASLSGKDEILLRPLKVEAEDCDSYDGVSKNRPSSTNYMRISPLKQNASILFNNIDLTNISGFTCRVSAVKEGGILEIRSGSIEGDLLAKIEIPSTGNDLVWTNTKGVFSEIPKEKGDVYLIFKHTNPEIVENMFHLDWIEFNN